MNSKVVKVSPELAAEWLKRNENNRELQNSRVKRYVRDMVNGRWKLTPQGISFDPVGRLLDGQHRLNAVVVSGCTVEMVVFYDVPPDAMLGMDQGGARTGRDLAPVIDHVRTPQKVAGVANAMYRGMANKTLVVQTAQEQYEYQREHRAAIDFALEHYRTHVAGLKRTQVPAVLARAYYTVHHPTIIKFASILQNGMAHDPQDITIIQLRDHLLSGRMLGSAGAIDTYRKTVRALDAFRRGQVLTKLFAASREQFPLPGEDGYVPPATELKAVG